MSTSLTNHPVEGRGQPQGSRWNGKRSNIFTLKDRQYIPLNAENSDISTLKADIIAAKQLLDALEPEIHQLKKNITRLEEILRGLDKRLDGMKNLSLRNIATIIQALAHRCLVFFGFRREIDPVGRQ